MFARKSISAERREYIRKDYKVRDWGLCDFCKKFAEVRCRNPDTLYSDSKTLKDLHLFDLQISADHQKKDFRDILKFV